MATDRGEERHLSHCLPSSTALLLMLPNCVPLACSARRGPLSLHRVRFAGHPS